MKRRKLARITEIALTAVLAISMAGCNGGCSGSHNSETTTSLESTVDEDTTESATAEEETTQDGTTDGTDETTVESPEEETTGQDTASDEAGDDKANGESASSKESSEGTDADSATEATSAAAGQNTDATQTSSQAADTDTSADATTAASQTTASDDTTTKASDDTSKKDSESIIDKLFGFRLNKTAVSGYIGDTVTLKAYNTKNAVTWKSSDEEVASISKDGKITMNGSGKAVITAKSGTSSATCNVEVAGLNVDHLVMEVEDTYQLKLMHSKSWLTVWTSADPSIASVNRYTGKVTAKDTGDTTITVAVGGHKYNVKVKVTGTKYQVTYHAVESGATVPVAESVLEGTEIADLEGVQEGAELDGYNFVGWYTDEDLTRSYADDAVVEEDMDLYAYMLEDVDQVVRVDDHYGVRDVDASYEMIVSAYSAEEVKENVTLVDQNVDQTAALTVVVTPTDEEDRYAVVCEGGFEEGHSYQMTVDTDNSNVRIVDGDGEVMNGACKLYNITVHKDEIANLELDDNIIYIQKSAISDFTGVLADGVLNVDESGNSTNADYTGTFVYEGGREIAVGDLVCLYTGQNPCTLTVEDDGNMDEEDTASYVKITAVSGDNYTYTAADFTEVMNIPNMIPMTTGLDQDGDTTDNTMTVSEARMLALWASIDGYVNDGQVTCGDIMVICTGDSYTRSTDASAYRLAKVTSVKEEDDTLVIDFQDTTEDAVEKSTEIYQEQELDLYDSLSEEEIEAIEDEAKEQAMESGFAEEAATYLASLAVKTDDVQELFGNADMDTDLITVENADYMLSDGSTGATLLAAGEEQGHVKIDNLVICTYLNDRLEHYEDEGGVRLVLGVTFDVIITPKTAKDDKEGTIIITNDNNKNKNIKIHVTADFVQEVMADLDYDGEGGIDWWSLSFDYDMTTSIDIGSYTALSIAAEITTSENKDVKYEAEEVDKYTKQAEKFSNMGKKIKAFMDAEEKAEELYDLEQGGEVQSLTERYSEMLNNDSDYLELVKVKLLETKTRFLYNTCVLKLEINAVLTGNINISLGMNLECAKAKTYGFHAKLSTDNGMEKFEGFSDDYESFMSFEAYAMGTLGLKLGLNVTLTVGVIHEDLCSAALSGEVGLFAKLYAMAYFKYDSEAEEDEQTQYSGAILVDAGFYAELGLTFQLWNETFKKEVELASYEKPFFYLGTPMVILGYHDTSDPEPTTKTVGNNIYFQYDEDITLVDAMDMRDGTYYGGTGSDDSDVEVDDPLDYGYPIDIKDFEDGSDDDDDEEETEWSKFWADLADLTDVDEFFKTIGEIEEVAPYSTSYNFTYKISITDSDGDAEVSYDPDTNTVTVTPAPTTRMVKGKVVLSLKEDQPIGKYVSQEGTIISRTLNFEWSVDEELVDINYHYNDADDDADETVYTIEEGARAGYIVNSTKFFDQATPVREGYTFIGWSTNDMEPMYVLNYGNSAYDESTTGAKHNNEINFYAVWKPNTIYVNGKAQEEDGRFSVYPYTGDAVYLKDINYLTGSFKNLPTWVGVDITFKWNATDKRYELYYDGQLATEMNFVAKANTNESKAVAKQIKSVENALTSYRETTEAQFTNTDMDTLSYGTYTASGETNLAALYATRHTVTIEPGFDTSTEAVEIQVPHSAKYNSLVNMTEITREGYYIAGFKNVDTGDKISLTSYITKDQHLEIIWKLNKTSKIVADYYLVNDDGSVTTLETGRATNNVPSSKVFRNSEEYDPYTLPAAYTADGQIYEKIVGNVTNGGDATASDYKTSYTVNGSALYEWIYQANGSTTNPTHLSIYFVEKKCTVTFVDELNNVTFTKTLKAGTSFDAIYKAELEANYPKATYLDTDWYYLKVTDAAYNGVGCYSEKTEITDDGAQVLLDYDEIVVYKEAKASTVTVNLYQMDENGNYTATPTETKTLTLENAGRDVTLLGNINSSDGKKKDSGLSTLMSGYRSSYSGDASAFIMDHVSLNMGDQLLSDKTYAGYTFWSDLNSVYFGRQYGEYTINVYVKRLPVTFTFTNVPVVENGVVTNSNGTVTVNTYTGVKVALPTDSSNVVTIDKCQRRSGTDATVDLTNGTIVCDSCGSQYTGTITGTYRCNWYLNQQPVVLICRGYYSTSKTVYCPAGQTVSVQAPIADTLSVTADQTSQSVTIPELSYSKTTYVYFTYTHSPYTVTLNVDGKETQVKCDAGTALGKAIAEAYGDDPEKRDFEFVGWTTEYGSEADLINNGWATNQDYYLYALFKRLNKVYVYIDGSPYYKYVEEGTNLKSFLEEYYSEDPELDGYVFEGWSTKEDDLTGLVTDSDVIGTGTTVVFAVFKKIHNIQLFTGDTLYKFTCLDGDSLMDAYLEQYGSKPTMEGYTFIGFTTEENDYDTLLADDAVVTENMLIFSYFVSNTIDIEWNLDGGTATTEGDTQAVDGQGITAPEVEKEGYEFWYWADQYDTYHYSSYQLSNLSFQREKYKNDTALTFTAYWKKKQTGILFLTFDSVNGSPTYTFTDLVDYEGETLGWYMDNEEGWKEKYEQYFDATKYDIYLDYSKMQSQDTSAIWTYDESLVMPTTDYKVIYLLKKTTEEASESETDGE